MPGLAVTDTRTRVFLLDCLACAAAVFRGPDAATWTRLVGPALPGLRERAPGGAPHATRALEKLQCALEPADDPERENVLETEFVRLFVAGRGGAVAPPYESCHQGDRPRTMGEPALAMQRRLDALGLAGNLGSNEPPDHLALELEYLYHLLATAWTGEDAAREDAARAFAAGTLAPWLVRFHRALVAGDAHPAYAAAAELARAVIEPLA